MECSCKKTIRDTEDKKILIARTNRIAGQIKGIAKMFEEDRYCDDILIQLVAIDKSIKSLANILLEKHLKSCVVGKIKNNDTEIIDEVITLFKRFQ